MREAAESLLRSSRQPNIYIYLNLDVMGTLLLGALGCELHFGMHGALGWSSYLGEEGFDG